jgi:hypothetical protein
MKTTLALAVLVSLLQAEPKSHAGFDRLKKLEGAWESTDKEHPAKVNFRLSSGGSILVESIAMANHSEMLTIYHPDGEDLVLTHYCMLGNQPRMRAEKGSTSGTLRFAFDGGGNMKPEDKHMHSLTLTLVDADHLKEEWALYDGGKEQMVVTINLARKKE